MEIVEINIEGLQEELEKLAYQSGYGGRDAPSLGAEEAYKLIMKRIDEVNGISIDIAYELKKGDIILFASRKFKINDFNYEKKNMVMKQSY